MHKRFRSLPGLSSVLSAALLLGTTMDAGAQFSVSRFTIDGGGGTRSSGGAYALGGTIGQPDAGRLSGSSFTLLGGFWSGGAAVTAVGNDDGVSLPLAFLMHPATPNPLAARTLIAFELPRATVARVALYDASGRLVRILTDGLLPAGRHEQAWDRRDQSGQSVSSGIYFLRMDAGPNQSSQKLVVVR